MAKGRPKGLPKYGGRKKGTENKVTQDARALFINIMEGEVSRVKESLDEIRKESHFNYIKCLTNLYPYFMPRTILHEVKDTTEIPLFPDISQSDKDE